MNINNNFYPDNIFQPLTPYVYFNDLDEDILDIVAKEFATDLTTITSLETGTNSIEDALTFLENIIQSERMKEEAFLIYLKGETKNILDINIPNLDQNWNDFVKEIQQNLKVGNFGLTDLQNELARLEANSENYDKAVNKEKTFYNIDNIKRTSNFLKDLLNKLNTQPSNSTSVNKIITVIINKFKDSLLTINENSKKLDFNKDQLTTLIISISQIIISFYFSSIDEKRRNNENNYLTTEAIEKILDEDLTDRINNLIKRAKEQPWVMKDLMQTYHITPSKNNNSIRINSLLNSQNELIQDSNQLVNNLLINLKDYSIPEKAFKIVSNPNDLAEIQSLLSFELQGALTAKNTGAAGAKPDNIIGFLTIDTNYLSPFESNEKNKLLLNKIKDIVKKIDQLTASLAKTNTTEYYQKQAEIWQKTCKEIDKALKEISQVYEKLVQCFLIEDSTKNYLSLYAREEDALQSHGVHGGSLGANLQEQLNKIEALTKAGAITLIDKKWLTAAIINSGPNMIAMNQKNQLENYLSIFAGILLFDSQINIVQDSMNMISKKIDTNVHQIHLFSVNNGYYPLSYVLKLTRDNLRQNFNRIEEEETTQGITTTIYGYVNKPTSYSIETWSETANQALKSTKIKMKFLVHFMNVLKNLLPDSVPD